MGCVGENKMLHRGGGGGGVTKIPPHPKSFHPDEDETMKYRVVEV